MLPILPNEIIVEIADYLSDYDYISFANVNKKFLKVLAANRRYLKYFNGYNAHLASVDSFLKIRKHLKILTKLDFHNCYWIDATELTKLISQLLTSLNVLSVHGTQLQSKHLVEILKNCSEIHTLSASLEHEDSSFWITTTLGRDDVEQNLNNCAFTEVKNNLSKLRKLSLYGDVHSYIHITIFLCFCAQLKQIHFEMLATGHVLELEEIAYIRPQLAKYSLHLPPFRSLQKVTSRVYNSNFVTNFFLASFVWGSILDRISISYPENTAILDLLWIPHGGMSSTLPFLKKSNCIGLLTAGSSNEIFSLENLNYLAIRADSARTSSHHVIRDATSRLPHLKMLSCSYNPKEFLAFAKVHWKELRVIQFQSSHHHCHLAGSELAQGIAFLSHLEKFSIDPRYFRDCTKPHLCVGPLTKTQGKRENHKENNPLSLTLFELAKCCPMLDEVEIGVFSTLSPARYDREDHICEASSMALTAFSHCTNLVKLTLANLSVNNFSFLSCILSGCTKLKSCRLTNICATKPDAQHDLISIVVKELKTGFPLSNSLEDFRWEVGKSKNHFKKRNEFASASCEIQLSMNGSELLDALGMCRSLRRLSIIADYSVKVHFPHVKYLEWSSPLVLACFISPSVDWGECLLQINSSHPAFQKYLGPSKVDAARHLPVVHYHDMVLFDSDVAKMPYSNVII